MLKNEESASVILLNPSAVGRFLKKSVTYAETVFASKENPANEIPLKFAISWDIQVGRTATNSDN